MININQPDKLEPESATEIPSDEIGFLTNPEEELIENEDGSVDVPMGGAGADAPQEFAENIAERLSDELMKSIATKLLESIDYDKTSREKRDQQYEEGIRRTGLGDDAPGGATFNGASKVVHPVLAESCIDFAARAIKEVFPASGPVRMETTGVLTPPEELEIKKLSECLNNQFTKKIREYRNVVEQKLTQLPLGGSQFTKFYPSKDKGRVVAEFVPVDNLFIPFYADSFYEAERVTHRQFLTQSEVDVRIINGQYRDIALIQSILEPEQSSSNIASDKIEGKTASGFNEDGTRTVYEVYTWLEVVEDSFSSGSRAPYIVTIDQYDESVLSIRRNWAQEDQLMQKLDWIVEDIFIPWRGAYGIGLPHLIGGLSGAATGALRALLDSAHINNAPTLLKLKGSKMSGQTKQIDVTQVVEIEGPIGVDDIRKYLMPMPFNPPSPVLFQLLGWLTDAAKGVVSTASEKIADATSNTPVGTTQALIEQGAIIFSSIHSRLHFSQAVAFEVVLRILKQYFPEQLQEYGVDPAAASMKGIHPVSDPNIFSEAQRMSQMQGALQLSDKAPQLYNLPELHKSMLSLMKVNQSERFLIPPPPQPQPMDPAGELVAFLTGVPVAVAPQQDHMSHIQVHIAYLQDPMLGMNPVMISITSKILDHLREHLGHFFASRLQQMVAQQQQQQQMAAQQQQMVVQQLQQKMQVDMSELQQMAQQNMAMGMPEQEAMGQMQQIAQQIQQDPANQPPQAPPQETPEQMMAKASMEIIQQDSQFAQQMMEIVNKTDQFVRDRIQSQDPNMKAVIDASKNQQLEIERKAAKDEMDNELANRREDNLRKLEALKGQEAQRQADFDQRMKQVEMNQSKNMDILVQKVTLMKNDADNRQTQITELLKNHDDNKTSVILEQIRAMMSQIPPQELVNDVAYVTGIEQVINETPDVNSTLNGTPSGSSSQVPKPSTYPTMLNIT